MHTTSPLVSIMVPIYGHPSLAREAIRSALAQDYPHLEVVACDDCSPDIACSDLVQDGCSRLRVYRNPKNLGRTENYRHLLYDLAQGEWVLMLDGDDVLTDPTYVRTAMEKVAADPDLVCIGAGHIVNPGAVCHRPVAVDATLSGETVFWGWEQRTLAHLTCLYRRDLACSLDFYREDIESSDYESLLRLFLHGRVCIMARTVGIWQHHGGNTSSLLDYEQFARNHRAYAHSAAYAVARGLPRAKVAAWSARLIERQRLSFLLNNILARYAGSGARAVQAEANLTRLRREYCAGSFLTPRYAWIWRAFYLVGPWSLYQAYRACQKARKLCRHRIFHVVASL